MSKAYMIRYLIEGEPITCISVLADNEIDAFVKAERKSQESDGDILDWCADSRFSIEISLWSNKNEV